MAFDKQITTASGYSASYWVLTEWSVNTIRREASGVFRVFKDEQMRISGGLPATEQVAKVRLSGEVYELYFGPGRVKGIDDQTIFYTAAKEEGVISDFGGDPDSHGRKSLFKEAKKS